MNKLEANDPKPRKFWEITFGQLVTAIIFVASLIYGTSAFITKSSGDAEFSAKTSAELSQRLEQLDANQARLDRRLTVVETGVSYIKDSVGRIETTINNGR